VRDRIGSAFWDDSKSRYRVVRKSPCRCNLNWVRPVQFVEGIIDHQILGLHHLLPDDPHQFLYDMMFLASGVVLFLIGWSMRGQRTT